MRGQEKSGIVELGKRSIMNIFEHPMATYSAALAYRGLFGLFPFLLTLVMLVGAIGFPNLFDRAVDHAQEYRRVPGQLEPVVEPARQRFRSVALGAALAVILWAISSVAFAFYLANFRQLWLRVREHRGRCGLTPVPLHLRFGGVAWCGAQRGDLLSSYGR